MNKLEIFNHPDFGNIRTTSIGGEPWFVGKDVAEALGYSNSRKAIQDHVDDEDKGVTKCDTLGGMQELTIINESGVYALVFGSKLEKAKRFKRWVTSEVLPSIRKTGAYGIPKTRAEALRLAADLEEQNAKLVIENTEMRPKALFADSVSCSESTILVGDLAKLISKNGVEIGQNRLFEWLRNHDYLMKKGKSKNLPTQRALDMGLFDIRETVITNANGSTVSRLTTRVTGKGQVYFVDKFCHDKNF